MSDDNKNKIELKDHWFWSSVLDNKATYVQIFLASIFNGDLSSWDVSSGTNFGTMFRDCHELESDFSTLTIPFKANTLGKSIAS